MKSIFTILFTIIAFGLFAQGIIITANGGTASLVSNGASNIIIGGNGGWTNNGTANLIAGGSQSTVKFVGNASQTIGGSSSTTFYNITVSNSSTGIVLGNNINVNGTLYMGTGDFDLRNYNIDLGTAGLLNNESGSSRIKVTPVLTGGNNGQIIATRTLVSGLNSNIAGLRIDINSTTYTGAKTIYCGHQQLAGTGIYSGNVSALLYYLLPGIGQLSNNNLITINYLDAEYTNNLGAEANLQIFHQIVQGGAPWFTPVTSTVVTATNKINSNAVACPYDQYVCDRLGLITFNQLITLGSIVGDHPLPIELITFTARCETNRVNIEWSTATEINNDYFTLEKSTDGDNWFIIATVPGAGNSNAQLNYHVSDPEVFNGPAYYSLKQTDYDGASVYYNPVVANCSKQISVTEFNNLFLFDNPKDDKIIISFDGKPGEPYTVIFIDQLGRKLYNKLYYVSAENEKISISKTGLAIGVYNIIVFNSTTIKSKQIAIISK
ncbi:MAG: hypothetical protein HY958_04485 [Bacteroidia bacterium]|nr:hypothetical protein [Bacteroidia bacterium]